MSFLWSDKKIRWYLEAEKTTQFHREVTRLLRQYLKETKTVLDIGCGLGTLAAVLAREGLKVTAIDISGLAVSVLEERIKNEKLVGIKPVNIPFEEFPPTEKFDMVIISYVMGLIENEKIEKIISHARKYVVIILPVEEIKNDFSVRSLSERVCLKSCNLRQKTYRDILPLLNEKRLNYKLEFIEAEFGQPFRSRAEAGEFVKHYFEIPLEKERELEGWLSENLQTAGDNRYYLPNKKKSAVIIIRKGEFINDNV